MSLQDIGIVPLIAGASAFALVLAFWGIGLILYGRRRAAREELLRARLGAPNDAAHGVRTLRLWHAGTERTVTVRNDGRRPRMWERLEERRLAAGWVAPLERLLLIQGLTCLVAALVMYGFTGRLLPAALGVASVLFGTWWYVNLRVIKRMDAFNRQLIDALDLTARALRAGHPLSGSFQLVAQEVQAPVGTIFAEICQQQEMGLRLEDALRRAAALSRSPDMRLLAATLTINLRTGGNMADVMQGLARVIRERMRLGRRFRTLFAQTQFSKRLLLAMPFAALLSLQAIAPDYLDVLYATRAGNLLLLAAGVCLFLGWLLMNQMAKVRI